MFAYRHLLNVATLGVVLSAATLVYADPATPEAFGATYTPVAPVTSSQAQMVLYRPALTGASSQGAHVYVEKEFHTALLPGGYNTLCVTPGQRSVGAYLNDAPRYTGKTRSTPFNLEGGKTYFMRVSSDGAPQVVPVAQAQRELAESREQTHTLSRASAVQTCESLPVAKVVEHVLPSDVLFDFGKSTLTSSGREAVTQLANGLLQNPKQAKSLDVTGHTDPIGSTQSNRALGLKRAETVRNLLIQSGLPASAIRSHSAGSSEPLSSGCKSGTRREQIACYAQDRRVVVKVNN